MNGSSQKWHCFGERKGKHMRDYFLAQLGSTTFALTSTVSSKLKGEKFGEIRRWEELLGRMFDNFDCIGKMQRM